MITRIRQNKGTQLVLGLLTGIGFGIFLQRSSVTNYDVILEQLLLRDFTVVKVMLSAIVVGMPIVYLMKQLGWIRLHPKSGSIGTSVYGGLLFGVGFAVMGFCPGTISGAIGQGALDALFTGSIGILLGSWLFANWYPKMQKPILSKGDFGSITLVELLKVNAWVVVIPSVLLLSLLLYLLEKLGL
ncbi:MAG: YeeE/YedE thiosulfate transporter family protein [Anaerolineae bacterium]|nr:YeeE/YedE thiosulfate transporter family protein [Anaerolineae bacterium]